MSIPKTSEWQVIVREDARKQAERTAKQREARLARDAALAVEPAPAKKPPRTRRKAAAASGAASGATSGAASGSA